MGFLLRLGARPTRDRATDSSGEEAPSCVEGSVATVDATGGSVDERAASLDFVTGGSEDGRAATVDAAGGLEEREDGRFAFIDDNNLAIVFGSFMTLLSLSILICGLLGGGGGGGVRELLLLGTMSPGTE